MSMSEKQYYITDTGLGLDTVSGEMYSFGDEEDFCRLFDKLNEQQVTISALKEENEQLKEEYKIAVDEMVTDYKKLEKENEQLKQEIKQHWKCRDKWKQEAKELKKEADYFERKKCEYWNMYNEAHSDRIILKKENEQLRKQIQNYEQLISNSYVGEEETLDGFVGKYVIWENELQKYKNKNEMIDDE